MKNEQNTSKMRAYSKCINAILMRGFNSLNAKNLEANLLYFICQNKMTIPLKLNNA